MARLRDAGNRVPDVLGLAEGQAFPTQGVWIQLAAVDADGALAVLVI